MKKFLSSLTVFALFVCGANAQLTVYPNGHVGVATASSTTPVSTFTIRGEKTGYEASVMGTNRGIYGESNGHYLNWSYALYGKSNFYTASFQCGLEARAIIPTAQSSYRTYGVIGIAGNATSGWNYGVHGQLNGTNNGAGVYGRPPITNMDRMWTVATPVISTAKPR